MSELRNWRWSSYRATAGLEKPPEWLVVDWALSHFARGRSARGGEDKKAAVYLSRKLTRLGGREVGAAFGVKAARVSHIVASVESDPSSALARRIARLRRRLANT